MQGLSAPQLGSTTRDARDYLGNAAAAPVQSLTSIQFLRFAAATLVVLHHAHTALIESAGTTIFSAQNYIFKFGAVGVHIFFCISGFIMFFITFSGERSGSSREFLARRLIRLFPLYWLGCIAYLTFHYLNGSAYKLTWIEVLNAMLLIPGYASLIIGPGWTLAFEMFFYICFTPLVALRPRWALFILCTAMPAIAALGAIAPAAKSAVPVLDFLLLEFAFGAVIAYALITWRKTVERWGPMLLAGSVLLFAFGLAYGFDRLPASLAWGVPSALMVAGAVGCESRGSVPLWFQRVSSWGDYSYAQYLIHILALDIILMIATPFVRMLEAPILWVVAATALICLLSYVVHRWLERPLLALLRPLASVGISRRRLAVGTVRRRQT